jgi:subtilisin family serine protease
MLKEYIVALNKGVNYNQVWDDIENPTFGLPHIPDRAVGIADNLDALDRITHYFLTDEEAEKLRNDPRVLGVEIPAEHRDDIVITLNSIQTGNFTKTNSSTGNIVNWGLIRNSNPNNIYGSSATTASNYNYAVNGSNVDIVIIDSGIQINHPEFGSRVNAYQWTNTVNTSTFYTDYNGHGTHVAGIAAGANYGWAKNSNIYMIKFTADPADPDQGFTGQSFGNIANILVSWQNSKPVNPSTGVKNPTVVNMSFGYGISTSTYYVSNVTYRGTVYANPTIPNSAYGLYFYQGVYPVRNLTYDAYVDVMTAAGINVIKAAGNDGLKIDVSGGADYNNIIQLKYIANNVSIGTGVYMRGASPISNTAIVVGALNSTTYSSTLDAKAYYSDAGPGVDIFAAGSNIQSSVSNISNLSVDGAVISSYYLNSNFKQTNINGTSMAAPQIAGIAALYLQANPTATPDQVKSALTTVATTTMIGNISTNPSGNDYSNTVSQWGGNAGVAYMQYNTATNSYVTGPITMTNITINTQ